MAKAFCSNGCTISPPAVNNCLSASPQQPCTWQETPGSPEYVLRSGGRDSAFRNAYSHCDGQHFPWFIYKNLGNGQLSTTASIKYNPSPVETEDSDGAITGQTYLDTNKAITDFDGDGHPDIIVRGKSDASTIVPFWWFVYLGDGAGGFPVGPYVVNTPTGADINTSTFYSGSSTELFSSGGMMDINGDGLPDQWRSDGVNPATFAINNGTGFKITGTNPFYGTLALPSASTRLGTSTSVDGAAYDVQGNVLSGNRWSKDRYVDADGDGRLDMVNGPVGAAGSGIASAMRVYFNLGGTFTSASMPLPTSFTTTEFRPLTSAVNTSPLLWRQNADTVDLDGDGIAEYVSFTGSAMTRVVHDTSSGPPRLMTSIDNHRGLVTSVKYDTMHGASVIQTPGAGHTTSPHNQWVVKAVSSSESTVISGPPVVGERDYTYKNPRYLADDEGRYDFRGFDEVSEISPTGQRTVTDYSYSLDWSGRVVKVRIYPSQAESLTDVRSIEITSWEARSLFNGAVTTYHPLQTDRWTCRNGHDEALCTANGDGFTRLSSTLISISSSTQSGGPALLWKTQTSRRQASSSQSDGDRTLTSDYSLVADGATYRLLSIAETETVQVSGSMQVYGKTAHTYDPSKRAPVTKEVWRDSDDTHRAITVFDYDYTTGNLTQRWKPEQSAAGGAAAIYSYDPKKLFVVTEQSEPAGAYSQRIVRNFVYDYGTGTKVETIGPNGTPATWGTAASMEDSRQTIDGIGRTLGRWVTVADSTIPYQSIEVEYTSYQDSAPASVHVHSAFDYNRSSYSQRWSESLTELDGHGRAIRRTEYVQGTAPLDSVSTYRYDAAGRLVEVAVPDASQNSSNAVKYSYAYDSLNRATSVRRPDSDNIALRSGVDIAYDGLLKQQSEVTGAGGGVAGTTKTTKDSFGRVVEIDEDSDGTAWATTTYGYDPNDRVSTIVGPAGSASSLSVSRDFLGHVVKITRNGSSWYYQFDKNGNQVSETLPGSTSVTQPDLNFVNVTIYDALDRPIKRNIGQRGLSPSDAATFGAATEVMVYDAGSLNGIGRLTDVYSYGPGASQPTSSSHYTYDALGRLALTPDLLT